MAHDEYSSNISYKWHEVVTERDFPATQRFRLRMIWKPSQGLKGVQGHVLGRKLYLVVLTEGSLCEVARNPCWRLVQALLSSTNGHAQHRRLESQAGLENIHRVRDLESLATSRRTLCTSIPFPHFFPDSHSMSIV